MTATAKTTVVSCPGKVFIAGGYLVLEPQYSGLVVGTASRFYTVVQDEVEDGPSNSTAGKDGGSSYSITVRSPQFRQAVWTYAVRASLDKDSPVTVTQTNTDEGGSNKFVHLTLQAALGVSAGLGHPLQSHLNINIVGDNDFYSQDRTATTSSSPAPFAHLNTTIADVHKTGLGSSAAMVTSLAGAILTHLNDHSHDPRKQPPRATLGWMHNIAQYAHSHAQGKVGSGFDVSVAVYGSQLYTRFSPECLSALLEQEKPTPAQLVSGLSPASEKWAPSASTSSKVEPFAIPPLTTLILADVDAGSNTPSMVGKVLKWKKANQDQAEKLWGRIAASNMQLAKTFSQLADEYKTSAAKYQSVIQQFSRTKSSEWQAGDIVQQLLCQTRDTIKLIRKNIKAMGEAAEVPIEPDEQTRLLDACIDCCPGVLGGGVPGAGGYDAIWLLVLSPEAEATMSDIEQQITAKWLEWKEMSVRPLSSKARIQSKANAAAGVDAFDGLQTHALEDVDGLAKVLQ